MRLTIRGCSCLALLLLAASPLLGQVPDLRGTWDLEMEVFLTGQDFPCQYTGSANITVQDGTAFQGMADLQLTNGPEVCPGMMSASLSGEWVNGQLQGTLDGGEAYGMASFSGSLGQQGPTQTAVAKAAAPGTTYVGPFTVTSGPFAGASGGGWMSVARGFAVLAIPGLGPAGLTALILLLLVGGSWLLIRGRLV